MANNFANKSRVLSERGVIMNKKKSAKDIAFDKERTEFRKEIRELKREVSDKDIEIHQLRDLLSQKENELLEKGDWIRRLLEYMDLSEDDLKKFVNNEKIKVDIYDGFGIMDKMFSKYFRGFNGIL